MSDTENKNPEADSSPLQSIKRGWGQRLWSTGTLAGRAAQLATRQLLGSNDKKDAAIGEALAGEFDKMKGMAMKVGQILSYFDGILPDETNKALRRLQHGSQTMSYEVMKDVLEEALAAPVEELFESFPHEPKASASIGQVYKARYEGRDVAVKVQYPGIWETIRSDFSVLYHMSSLASLATAVDGQAIVDDLRQRFGEECDYLREASFQEAFRKAFADDPEVVIPAVHFSRTRANVLTSEWWEGLDLYTFTEKASSKERQQAAKALMRFAYRSFYALGTLNADPHPGNYLFLEDGRVVFLDFGCIRQFDPSYVEHERQLAKVVIENRKADFRDALLATGLVSRPKKFDFEHHWLLLRHQYAPYIDTKSGFAFTQDYLKKGMEYSQPSSPNLRQLAIPPEWIWIQRLQWGLHAVLVRLQAEGNFASIFQEAIEQPLTPLQPKLPLNQNEDGLP